MSSFPPWPFIRLELRSGSNPLGHLAETENFHAITQLNWRSYYAMGMIGLGQEIKAARLLQASLKPRNFVGACQQAMAAALPVLKQRPSPDEPC